MTLWIASDHAAYALKETLKRLRPQLPWQDLGTHSTDSVDYPDYANLAAEKLREDPDDLAVVLCGSGVGVAIAANRHKHVRAVLAQTPEVASLGREHNYANMLCMGARIVSTETALAILDAFLNAKPDLSERHARRVQKLSQ